MTNGASLPHPQPVRTPLDPQSHINYSFQAPVASIAALTLLWQALGRPASATPFEEYLKDNEVTALRLTEQSKKAVQELLEGHPEPLTRFENELINSIQDSSIASGYSRALTGALGMLWKLAQVEFADEGGSIQGERQGGHRYSKNFQFTLDMEYIGLLYDAYEDHSLIGLLALLDIGVTETQKSSSFVTAFKKTLAMQSEHRVYETKNSSNETFNFERLGVYESLLEGHDNVAIGSSSSPLPTRVLRDIFRNGLVEGITMTKNTAHLQIEKQNSLAEYAQKVATTLRLTVNQPVDSSTALISSREDDVEETEIALDLPNNLLLYGVPGSGKSYTIEQLFRQTPASFHRVVFHAEYSYSDFVGTVRPTIVEEEVSYDFVAGPLTNAIRTAVKNPGSAAVLVIEEINRGNAAAIFGDTFQLLDRSDDGSSTYSIHNEDLGLKVHNDSSHPIRFPRNLFLVATMNSSDQNVFVLDNAFQRRWAMRLVRNTMDLCPFADKEILDTSVTWSSFHKEVNALLSSSTVGTFGGEDKLIGPFFVNETDLSHTKSSLDDSLSGLAFSSKVLKYLWDDAFKFNRADAFNVTDYPTLEAVISAFESKSGNHRWEVFSDNLITSLNVVSQRIQHG